MAFAKYPPVTTGEAIAVLKQDVELYHNIVHGDENTEVLTENGLVPSVDKVLKELLDRIGEGTGADVTLRPDLAALNSMVLVGGITAGELVRRVSSVSSISQLRSTEATYDDQILTVNAYYANGTTGGGDFQWDATSTAADDGGVTIAVTGVATGRWIRRLERFITPEMFGASGGNDTAAFEAACSQSAASGKYVYLSGKDYLIEPKPFLTANVDYIVAGIVGEKGARIKPFGSLKFPANSYILLHIKVLDGGLLENFMFDGQVSSTAGTPNIDPVWTSSNFDTWYGSRGMVVRDSNDYQINRVVGINCYAAPISEFGPTRSLKTNCISIRGRGNNGDLYYINAAVGCTEINCLAMDGTRIGFVSEAFIADTRLSTQITRKNCAAYNLHDGSVNYGGTEFNAGFWDEHSYNVTHEQCHAEDFGRFAFKASFVVEEVKVPSLNGQVVIPYHYKDCTAVNGDIMFQIATQQSEYPVKAIIENCQGANINWRFSDLGALAMVCEDSFLIKNSSVILSSVVGITAIQAAALCYSGEVKIDDLTVRYLGRNMTDYLSPTSASKTVSHFGSTASKKVRINDLKVFDEVGNKIGATICFRSTATTTDLIVTDTEIYGIDNRCGFCTYQNVVLNPLSTEVHKSFRLLDSKVLSIDGNESDFRVVNAISDQTEMIIDKTIFDLSIWSNYLHLFNTSKISTDVLGKVTNCKFIWDAATNGHVIRLDSGATLKNENDGIFNWELSGNEFVNTSLTTTNPIVFADGNFSNQFSVIGSGNTKSSTLLVDGNDRVNPSFSPLVVGNPTLEDVVVVASRNLTTNEFGKQLTNSTASDYVLTLTVNVNTVCKIGTEITLTKLGTGNISFTPTTPTTINGTTTFTVTSQYSSRKIRKIADDAWVAV